MPGYGVDRLRFAAVAVGIAYIDNGDAAFFKTFFHFVNGYRG